MKLTERATDRRWELRDATAASHHALDQAIGGFASMTEYEAYVLSNYRFRAALDHGLRNVTLDGWQPRPLVDALRADVQDLGLPLPMVPELPHLSGSALLGRLYVLEGAALGGQILRRQAQSLGLTSDRGARHLAGDVKNWTAFLSVLDGADPYDAGQAAKGACATFDAACAAFIRETT